MTCQWSPWSTFKRASILRGLHWFSSPALSPNTQPAIRALQGRYAAFGLDGNHFPPDLPCCDFKTLQSIALAPKNRRPQHCLFRAEIRFGMDREMVRR